MEIDRDGLEVLDRRECVRLLSDVGLGRLAVSSRALPLVVPVGFAMDGDAIVAEVARGTELELAALGEVVGFQVDNLHENGHSGWTVMVTGLAEAVDDPVEETRLRRLFGDVDDREDTRLVRISCELISGRRTHPRHRHTRSRAAARLAERL